MCDPHLVQKRRSLPGEDSKPARSSSPLVQRKCSRGTAEMDEKAEPCAFLHVRQWQCTIGPAGASTS
jgi:hypothetical protein